jgi:hypothetical protein
MDIVRAAYLQTIRERLRDNPIVSLVGPRQAGKTTLARMVAEASTEVVHFFDLESPADLARLANPELVLRPLAGLVILDEVQRRPDLFPLLRVLADRPDTPAVSHSRHRLPRADQGQQREPRRSGFVHRYHRLLARGTRRRCAASTVVAGRVSARLPRDQ